jgi:hypothetical protein
MAKKKAYTRPRYKVTAKEKSGKVFSFISKDLATDRIIIFRTAGQILEILKLK